MGTEQAMMPTTLSVITFLLLGAVSLTNSLSIAVSIKESMQNSFKKLLPQVVYPQEIMEKSILLNAKPVPEMVHGQLEENIQKSVQNVKPMYTQEEASLLENDIMAHTADDCSRLYNVCRETGDYNWFFCLRVLIDCRTH